MGAGFHFEWQGFEIADDRVSRHRVMLGEKLDSVRAGNGQCRGFHLRREDGLGVFASHGGRRGFLVQFRIPLGWHLFQKRCPKPACKDD